MAKQGTGRVAKATGLGANSDASSKTTARARKLQAPTYRSFRLSKRIKHPKPKLIGGWRVFQSGMRVLLKNWRLFGLMAVLYLVLTFLLTRGDFASHARLTNYKLLYEEISGKSGGLDTAFNLLATLIGNGNSPSTEVGGAYQAMLLLVMSLAVIWALRQLTAGHKIRLRDTFYKGMYPIVPFLLVLLVIFVQLVPLYAALSLYLLLFGGGIAVTAIEQALWLSLFALLALWSLYMVTSSVFALYIVTLPDVAPLSALRSARGLVQHRRWLVMRRVLVLPLALAGMTVLLLMPLILWLTPAAEWVFVVFSMFVPMIVHAYMYSLYRELIA